MDGSQLNGRNSLGILQRGLEGERKRLTGLMIMGFNDDSGLNLDFCLFYLFL